MFLVKHLKFFHLFIFGKISQQNVFDVILESKKAFLDYKKQKVKKVEKSGFFQIKGLVHGFVKKFEFFFIFLLQPKQGRKMFLSILQKGKRRFQTLKSQKFGIFPKGLVHGFGQKRYKTIKHRKVKKSNNWDFSKGVSPQDQ